MREGAPQKERKKATLIFDGACPICSATVEWIGENETEGSFEMLPCQAEGVREHFPGVDPVECMQAMRLVLPNGKVFVGERALPEIFKRLRRYRFVSLAFRLPGAAPLSRIAYRWFADRRYRIAALLSHRTGGKKKAA
jgi:predicted DCC family thiol-disulfide oxidoreductase YuxK